MPAHGQEYLRDESAARSGAKRLRRIYHHKTGRGLACGKARGYAPSPTPASSSTSSCPSTTTIPVAWISPCPTALRVCIRPLGSSPSSSPSLSSAASRARPSDLRTPRRRPRCPNSAGPRRRPAWCGCLAPGIGTASSTCGSLVGGSRLLRPDGVWWRSLPEPRPTPLVISPPAVGLAERMGSQVASPSSTPHLTRINS